MIGPYDMAGSLGVPGQTSHPKVIEASRAVIDACERFGKSCGTQVADVTPVAVQELFDLGHTYAILGSDLFVLWKWAKQMRDLMDVMRTNKA
jgi:2-dehydro-3-deoxyglucarate aldolase